MARKTRKTVSIQRPPKAYRNEEFLSGPDGRSVRVLCEFQEPATRFRRLRINHTICFFGSARIKAPEVADANLKVARADLRCTKHPSAEVREAYERATRDKRLSCYYRDAMELAEQLTAWSKTLHKPSERFIICSGGGPGIMEAANRGAANAGGHSIGLNISLPFEQQPNPYQSRELAFEFHYFFIRKFWFVHLAKAMAVFPGGFGTLDEFIELITLLQTGKTASRVPIVLYGRSFWREVINFDALIDWGMIRPGDVGLFHLCDRVDDAFDYLKTELLKTRGG
ncbi:MAG TPA: LOG family protein [Candidatus Hydrogenedentes bacterium]|nr:LOG family protein [Candidatus Hydrogenedentota bacterium]HPG65442.1 LOG family protein [Candidatus Hydrogenedentota bacterium]